ncbi:type II toxin-antitoxin system VapC family toxin [Rhodomicrobium lacus]|uniref:type II toxin-antitoxin system VapC family toxin n=1 Tax=Rhodomicrobium lacus TaxID=2498452 RepID=UPI0026E2E82C|nr:type II toxin-antitoxin system VapC family toxin [Rhodomicrobium lacus]WKW51630.1 type II toxin-antitoxin system VapC family toxin [Rhodomicrobium lacus]
MIAVDSSALVAILRLESDAKALLGALVAARGRVMSALNVLETSLVLAGREGDGSVFAPLDAFIAEAGIVIVPFDAEQAGLARAAFLHYGKGRHPAALNFGDCAAYALARSRGVPLLYKGADFARTDVVPALAV